MFGSMKLISTAALFEVVVCALSLKALVAAAFTKGTLRRARGLTLLGTIQVFLVLTIRLFPRLGLTVVTALFLTRTLVP